jgi:hypothetical protein
VVVVVFVLLEPPVVVIVIIGLVLLSAFLVLDLVLDNFCSDGTAQCWVGLHCSAETQTRSKPTPPKRHQR